jgi:uncharacterized beta-barrel protein YwiB (DUF1934 family)
MKRSFNENRYIISIDGIQIIDGDTDTINLSTIGTYRREGRKYVISYEESEATGMPGNTTFLTADGNRCVTMTRKGPESSQLIIELGKKHMCHYETGYGPLAIGVYTESITNKLSPSGGELHVRYRLDINSTSLVTNELKITVKEK